MSEAKQDRENSTSRSSDCYVDDYDEANYGNQYCGTCGGDGWVESVSEETGRYGWDTDKAGTCPNCKGSGDASDMWYW